MCGQETVSKSNHEDAKSTKLHKVPLSSRESMRSAIGVDLGGTHLRAVRIDEQGYILAHSKVRTAARAGPAAVVDQI